MNDAEAAIEAMRDPTDAMTTCAQEGVAALIENDPNDIQCDLAEEGAALGLLGLMKGISEEFWCAGWMSDLEFSLWQAKPGKHYGQGIITERQAELLRLLSEECGGWWFYGDAGPKFIRTEDWLKKIAQRP